MRGNLSWTCLKNTALLAELNAFGKVQGDKYPIWMVTQEVSDAMHYTLSTSWHANTKLHRENVPGSFSLRLHMMAELISLWKMVPMAIGLMPPSFLAVGISLAPKKHGLRWSGMNWWLAAILFLHSLQIALTASEFIYLMVSALHPSASLQLFSILHF